MKSIYFSQASRLIGAGLLAVFTLYANGSVSAEFSLQRAQQLAITQDAYLKGIEYRQHALEREQHVSGYWANPQLSTSIQNMPTDGFSLDQEPMTQFKIGVKQQLPRGNVNTLNGEKLAVQIKQFDVRHAARLAWLKKNVALAWLNWYHAGERLHLLEREAQLLNQLMDVTESRYSQGVGKAQQSDVLQVRLAQLTLEDKRTIAIQALREAHAALSAFYGAPLAEDISPDKLRLQAVTGGYNDTLTHLLRVVSENEPFVLLQQHPEAQAIQLQTRAQAKQVAIAREQTKSQWSVEASYGYRQDSQNGASRADFVSLGIQVDLPYFTQPKQNADIAAAVSRENALKTDFRLKVNELAAQAHVLKARLSSLTQRKALYTNGLTNEAEGLAQTLLNAYTADTANFSDVIDALLHQVQVQDALLTIEVEEAKTLTSLAYLYLPSIDTQTHKHQGM